MEIKDRESSNKGTLNRGGLFRDAEKVSIGDSGEFPRVLPVC